MQQGLEARLRERENPGQADDGAVDGAEGRVPEDFDGVVAFLYR